MNPVEKWAEDVKSALKQAGFDSVIVDRVHVRERPAQSLSVQIGAMHAGDIYYDDELPLVSVVVRSLTRLRVRLRSEPQLLHTHAECGAMPPVGDKYGVPGWVFAESGTLGSPAWSLMYQPDGLEKEPGGNVPGWYLTGLNEGGYCGVSFRITHCPWCGAKLPEPSGDEWVNPRNVGVA